MSANQNNVGSDNWEWVKLAKKATWILGIIAGILLPPPVPTEQASSIVNLTRFIVIVFIACLFYLTNKFKKYHHAKFWVASAIFSLMCIISGLFIRDYLETKYVCRFNDGRIFVMGNKLTPNGEDQLKKPLCQGCEPLIHTCGHDNPENIWEVNSIAQMRRFLILEYLSLIPVMVLCIISTANIISCSRQPNPRQYISGIWEGQYSSQAKITLNITLSPNSKGVSGILCRVFGIDNEAIAQDINSAPIQNSHFCQEYLFFSVIERGGAQRYRMTVTTSIEGSAILDKLTEKNKYTFYCNLKKPMTA